MGNVVVLLVVSLMAVGVRPLIAAPPAPDEATTRPAESEVRDSLCKSVNQLRDLARGGDVDAVAAALDVADPEFRPATKPMAQFLVSIEAAKAAADQRFGAAAGRASQLGLPERDEIAMAKVILIGKDGRRARFEFDPAYGGPHDPLTLVRVGADAPWKVSAQDLNREQDDDTKPEDAAGLAMILALGFEQAIPKILDGSIASEGDGSPVDNAASLAMGSAMGLQAADFGAAVKQLEQLQRDRQPSRHEAARKSATQAVSATQPVRAPLPPLNERDTPLKASRVLAAAVTRGDREMVAAMTESGAPAINFLARSNADYLIAQARFRAAAAKRIGDADAKRLPRNDGETGFESRFTEKRDGNYATINWHDDFVTKESPQGTARSLSFVRLDNEWKLAIASNRAEPYLAIELYHSAFSLRQSAPALLEIVKQIDAGELNTFEAINAAR